MEKREKILDRAIKEFCNFEKIIQASRATHGSIGYLVGLSGIPVFLSEMSRQTGDNYLDKVTHQYFEEIMRRVSDDILPARYPDISLVGGLSGINLALHLASNDGKRYGNALDKLDHFLLQQIIRYIDFAYTHQMSVKVYDVIFGLSGILLYTSLRSTAVNTEASRAIMNYFSGLIRANPISLLGFLVEPSQQPSERHQSLYPLSNIDLGVAHGVAGVISAMALAIQGNDDFDDFRHDLQKLSDDFVSVALPDSHGGLRWPSYWTPEIPLQNHQPARAAWCYGSPGISNALRLVANTLNDEKFHTYSRQSLSSVERILSEEQLVAEPLLCHGLAGIMHIINQSKYVEFEKLKEITEAHVLSFFNQEGKYTFLPEKDGGFSTEYSILEGMAGVCLSLAFEDQKSLQWDRGLGIA